MLKKIFALLVSKRFKSLYWRSGMMALAGFLALLSEQVGILSLSPQITIFIGLAFGEISKAINKMVSVESN